MSLSAHLAVSFALFALLVFVGLASAGEGSGVRRVVGGVLGFLMRRNVMLRGLHWLLTRRNAGTRVAYGVISLAWVWFVTVLGIVIRTLPSLSGGPPGPGFGAMPLAGQLFAGLVMLFIGTVWALVATAFLAAIVTYPLALATGLARRGGADRRFAVALGSLSAAAGAGLACLAWAAEA